MNVLRAAIKENQRLNWKHLRTRSRGTLARTTPEYSAVYPLTDNYPSFPTEPNYTRHWQCAPFEQKLCFVRFLRLGSFV